MTASSWWQLLPAVLLAGCFLWLPGFAIGLGWRLKLLAAGCLAPLLSLFIIGSSALAAHFTHQRWGAAWVTVLTCIVAVAGLWRWPRHGQHWLREARHDAIVLGSYLVGILIAVAVLGRRLLWALGSPSSIAQRYDNAFHLNASVYVYLTGNASGLDVGPLLGVGFYPASFHDAVALVMAGTGLWVAPAVHAVTLFAIFVMWPLSLILMLEPFFAMNWVGRFVLGPLSLGLNLFPYAFMDWGMLYPNILALCATPALIALGFVVLGKGDRRILTHAEALVLVVPAVLGAGLAHPNSVFLMVGACVPLAIITAIDLIRGTRSRGVALVPRTGRDTNAVVVKRGPALALGLGLLIAVFVVVPVVWNHASVGLRGSQWHLFQTRAQALGEVLMGTGMAHAPFPLGFLVIVGVLWLISHWRTRLWWVLAALMLTFFYVVTSAFPDSPFRLALVGVFYGDSNRTSAYLAVVLVPVAVLGCQWLWATAQEAAVRWRPQLLLSFKWVDPVVAIALAILLCSGTVRSTSFTQRMEQIHVFYSYSTDADILSADELRLLEEVKKVTSPSDIIVVDPWTGAGLVYALAQRTPTQFYMLSPVDNDLSVVNERLRYAAEDPQVCTYVHRLGATYVLSLDPRPITNDVRATKYAGLTDLASQPGFEPVVSVGQDTLYRITACS